MKLLKKWWFLLLVIILLILMYFVLSSFGVVPRYCCGSTMGPDGPVNWCQWIQTSGRICPVG